METHIRWLIKRDMLEAIEVDEDCFSNPWTDAEWTYMQSQKHIVTLVAECDDAVVGFVTYGLHRKRLEIIKIAVHSDYRRNFIGDTLIAKLRGKLNDVRTKIEAVVDERNLPAQLFFKAMGFIATEVIRGKASDSYGFELSTKKRELTKRQ